MEDTIKALLDSHADFVVNWARREHRSPAAALLAAKERQRDFRHLLVDLLILAGQPEAAGLAQNHEPRWGALFGRNAKS